MSERHTCYAAIDEALAEKGVRLSMNIQINMATGATVVTPRIPVEPLDSTNRAQKKAARTCNMLATYCPWCGVVLERV